MKKILALLLFCSQFQAMAQENPREPLWGPLQSLVGQWRGHETGVAGEGKGERVYEFILGGRYLLSKNISRFEPQERNPKGEVHQDWAIFSYDQNRDALIAREFNSEGFVNRLVQDKQASDESSLVFVSEASENAPPGLRARLTLRIKSRDELEEIFEIALPGKDFAVFLRNYWTRWRE